VAAVLREEGSEAEIQPAQKVGALNGHRALVLGAPLPGNRRGGRGEKA